MASIGLYLIIGYHERYKNKLTSYLNNMLVIFSSLFIIFIIIEIYLHIAQPLFLEMGRSIVGDLSDYKSQGYVDEKRFTKPENTFRILGLGDSFAVCDYDLGKNYHNYLAVALKNAGYNHIQIVNAGMPATGPGYYWHILEKYGDAWKPDLVLLGFFEGNDFEEVDFMVNRGPFIREPQDPWQRWPGYLRFNNFWLYKVVKAKFTLTVEKIIKSNEKKEEARRATFSNMAFLHIENKRVWIFRKDKKAAFDELWQKNSSLMLKFKEWCTQRQIPLVIAIFPSQFQVDAKLRQEIYQAYHLAADDLDLSYPNRLLSDYCREHGILCLDMLGAFQQQGASRTLYRLHDTHWNEAGNRLAGSLIFDYLKQNGLLRPH